MQHETFTIGARRVHRATRASSRVIGVSAVSLDELHQARALTAIAEVQNHFSLADRSGADVLDARGALGIASVPFFEFTAEEIVALTE